MPTFISFNKWQLYGKIILQPFVLAAVFFFAYPIARFGFTDPKMFLVLFFLIAAVFFVFFNLAQLIYLPIKVSIEDSNALAISFLLRKPRIIVIDDIDSFNFTRISTKSTLYDGIIVNLKNGKKALFSNFNLKDYLPLRQYLENSKIPFLGKINFKPVSFYRNCF